MALSGKLAGVAVQDLNGAPVPFFNAETTDSGDHKRYQITDSEKQYVDPNSVVTVKVNGIPAGSGYTFEYAGGYVEFDTPLEETDVVTISGKYLALIDAGGMYSWTIDTEATIEDVTTFASNGNKEFISIITGWSGKAEGYWGDKRFQEAIGLLAAIKFYLDKGPSKRCLEGFAILKASSVEIPANSVVKENIEIQGVGGLYFRNF